MESVKLRSKEKSFSVPEISELRHETDSLHLPLFISKNPGKIVAGSLVLDPRITYTVYIVLYNDSYNILLLTKEGKIFSDLTDKYVHVNYNFEFDDPFVYDRIPADEKIKIPKKMADYYLSRLGKTGHNNEHIFMTDLALKNRPDVTLKLCISISSGKYRNTSTVINSKSFKTFSHFGTFVLNKSGDHVLYLGLSRNFIFK